MIFYYSGCGNSKWVADQLALNLQEERVFIPKADHQYSIAPDEAVGFVFPVYSWAPPKIVTEFIESLQLSQTPKYLYMVCTCGDEAGRTPEIFRKVIESKEWHLDAAYSVQMPETYINLPGFKLDTPEGVTSKYEAAKTRLNTITEALKQRTSGIEDVVAGSMAGLKSGLVKWLFYNILITDKKFHVSDACVGCGICEKSCPVENIRMVDGRPQWQHGCIGCMGCYHHCPQNAINWGRQTEGKGQYYCKLKAEKKR